LATISKQSGKRGNTYKVRIRKPNSPTVTKTFSSKNLAEKWARKTELAIEEGTYFDQDESRKHTVKDLVQRYINEDLQKLSESDWRVRKQQLNWWEDHIGKLTLNKVSPSLLVEHRQKLKTEPNETGKVRKGSTVNRYMAALSAAFGIAVTEWQWMPDNPFNRVRREKEPKGRIRFLSPVERTALLDACKESQSKPLYLVVMLALSTGMRQGEIMSLKWEQVDINGKKITLFDTKNDDIRVVPLVGLASQLLKTLSKVRKLKNPYLFPGRLQSHAEFPRAGWDFAIEKAKIENFTFHDCRHSAASELAMNGASLHEIAAVLGHKTLAMVQRYAHLIEDGSIFYVGNKLFIDRNKYIRNLKSRNK
jgi:integrase